jgi:uncharacterized protein YaiE (UPF0345 family)
MEDNSMIKVNEYFEGKVKSLGNTLKERPFSIGIIEPGEYTFGTSTKEHMEVVFGEMEVTAPQNLKKIYKKGEFFKVDANSKFTVSVKEPISYICLYN